MASNRGPIFHRKQFKRGSGAHLMSNKQLRDLLKSGTLLKPKEIELDDGHPETIESNPDTGTTS